MTTEPIDIPISTDYDDQGAKDAIKDVEKLEKLDPEIEIDADVDKAEGQIDGLTDSAQALVDRNPWISEFTADTAQLKSELESAQTKLRETGEKADDTKQHLDKIGGSDGPRLAGNQVSDLTGPLGDASGAASDFGGVFDGLADISEKVAGKIGLDAAKMASAVSGIGFAVAIGAAAWTLFKQKQEEARKKAEELRKKHVELVEAIRDGNREASAEKFIEMYGDIIDKAKDAGLTIDETVDFITGTGDAADTAATKLGDLDAEIADLTTQYEELNTKTRASGDAATEEEKRLGNLIIKKREQRDALVENKEKYADLSAEQQINIDMQADVQDALFGTTGKFDETAAAADRAKRKSEDLTAAMDILKGSLDFERTMDDFEEDINTAMNNVALGVATPKEDIRSIEDTIIEVGEMAGKTPIEVQTVLDQIDAGDLFSVLNTAQSWANEHKVQVQFEVAADAKQKIRNAFAGFGINVPITGTTSGKSVGTASSQTINVHLPRVRHGDTARAQAQSVRRNGRRYGSNPPTTVRYARR
jgi:hypothetical protein